MENQFSDSEFLFSQQSLAQQLELLQAQYQAQEELMQHLLQSTMDKLEILHARQTHQQLAEQIEAVKEKIKSILN